MFKLFNSSVTNLTGQRQGAAGSLPPRSAALSGLCWHSQGHGSGHSHGPTPGGWNPRSQVCPCRIVRPEAGRPGRPSARRRAGVKGSHPPNVHSTVSWTNLQVRPAQAHGPRTILQYHRLQAKTPPKKQNFSLVKSNEFQFINSKAFF